MAIISTRRWPDLVQVAGEVAGAAAVVDVDEHHPVRHRPLDAHDRHAACPELAERGVVLQAAGGEDGRVQRDARDLLRRGPPGVAREQQQPDAVRAEHLRDAVEELDGDGVAERVEQPLADERADDPAAAAAQ